MTSWGLAVLLSLANGGGVNLLSCFFYGGGQVYLAFTDDLLSISREGVQWSVTHLPNEVIRCHWFRC